MARHYEICEHYETCEGLIEGVFLPRLDRENIRTISELRAVARQLERFEGIGPITARVIRQELDRVAAPGEQRSGGGQLSAWGA
jgi:hypothetical protein